MGIEIIQDTGYGLIPKSIMRDKGISIQAKAIYSYLASFSGNTGRAFPSIFLMADELGISKETLYKYLKELKEKNVITVEKEKSEKGKFSNNVYYLHNQRQKKEELKEIKKEKSPSTVSPCTEIPYTDISNTEFPSTEEPDTIINNSIINNFKSNSIKNIVATENCNDGNYKLALEFRKILLVYKPDSKVPDINNLNNWAKQIDYMIRLDERDPKKIIELLNWSQKDSFWNANIRSPKKLREKWDTLELQKNRNNNTRNNNYKKQVRTAQDIQNEWEDFINGEF